MGSPGAGMQGLRPLSSELHLRGSGHERREAPIQSPRRLHHRSQGRRRRQPSQIRQTSLFPRQALPPRGGASPGHHRGRDTRPRGVDDHGGYFPRHQVVQTGSVREGSAGA